MVEIHAVHGSVGANSWCQPPSDHDADLHVLGWGFCLVLGRQAGEQRATSVDRLTLCDGFPPLGPGGLQQSNKHTKTSSTQDVTLKMFWSF